MAVTIDLMRHGEPEGGSLFRGHSLDDELSDKGWQQMRGAIKAEHRWDAVVTSPLLRCKCFAEEVAKSQKISCEVYDDLKEIGFGHWEGKTRSLIRALHAREYASFYADPEHNTPKEAEPLGVFYRRVLAVLRQLSQHYDHQHLLLVAHAGVLRAILTHALDAPLNSMYKMSISNAAIIRVELGEQTKVYF